ncbi:MAG: hypothetical protein MJZ41_07670 [Bacteroidaceae bacterium]|nr:hypothetical protein [Bacteroidaceae bacterium]
MATQNYKYKVTYLHEYKALAFVRIADDALLYVNENEMYVRMYAEGFCNAKNEKFFIE